MSILDRLKNDNDVASYCYKDGYQISYSSKYGYYLFKTRNYKRSSRVHNISDKLAKMIQNQATDLGKNLDNQYNIE